MSNQPHNLEDPSLDENQGVLPSAPSVMFWHNGVKYSLCNFNGELILFSVNVENGEETGSLTPLWQEGTV